MRLKKTRDVGADEWNDFALSYGWFWHTTHWREYTRVCNGDEASGFAIMHGGELVAIVAAETPWAPAVRPFLDPRSRMEILDFCLAELERGPVRLQASPLVPLWHETYPPLDFAAATTRRGYKDASLTTSVVDLWETEQGLLAAMRKDTRRAIRHGEHIATKALQNDDALDTFESLYLRAAGPTTRPFHLVRRWLRLGHVVVVIAESDGEPVSAMVLLAYGKGAYPFAAATVPDRGVAGHAVNWAAMRWLREQGVRYFELGIQYRNSDSTEKQRNISLFKRGFGGVEMPLIIREKP